MKNIPRIFIDERIKSGDKIIPGHNVVHYLRRVMRTDTCLVFGNGDEYHAQLTDDDKFLTIGEKTPHADPSNNLTLMFAPIKRTDDLLNMATQMGVAFLQPVITERTIAHHINWERMHKIVVEAAEQSNRNSVPKILAPKKFADLNLANVVFADERSAYQNIVNKDLKNIDSVLIGPEGGFSEQEFNQLDKANATGISLGKTILRAEVAAVVAITKIMG